jgi:hypothetical protein
MPANDQSRTAAEHWLVADSNIGQALTRLDDLAGWEPGRQEPGGIKPG